MYIYYHQDFDGLAASILMTDYLKQVKRIVDIQYKPVNHNLLPKWHDIHLTKPCAVLDFRYHQDCDYWFDHHNIPKYLLNKIPFSDKIVSDTKFLSAASLVWNKLLMKNCSLYERWIDLVYYSDKIDSMLFENPEEVRSSKSSWLKLTLILHYKEDKNLFDLVRKKIMSEPNNLDKIISDKSFAQYFEDSWLAQESFFNKIYKESSIDEHGIVEHPALHYAFHKYLPYCVFPNIMLAIGVVYDKNIFRVIVTKNKWIENNKFSLINIGDIMQNYGGGGHFDRGGVPCKSSSLAEHLKLQVKQDILDIYGKTSDG